MPEGGEGAGTSGKMQNGVPGQEDIAQFRGTVAENAAYTRPYWHRNDPETEGLNVVDDARYATLAFPPSPLHAHVNYSIQGMSSELSGVGTVAYKDSAGKEKRRALAVAPPFSITIDPVSQGIPVAEHEPRTVKVLVRSVISGNSNASVKVTAPGGWQVSPASQRVSFANSGEVKICQFQVTPAAHQEGRFSIKASLEFQGKSYS